MREPSWRQEGQEPDYRFSLANERTFLAWVRTALALLAGGVLLDQFSTKLQPRAVVLALAIALCILAAVLCGLAYTRWRANEIAMRHNNSSHAPQARDPGLQGERTALSWSRTAWAVVANGLLALRSGGTSQHTAISVLALALLVAAGAVFG